jgi:rhamnose utilization protein RhaD (predicted bifunctional aldolase and dehydrogenase)/NAD(P)-dependent dehydrogenase (short-subunit alcohol dehydrogenase family)
MQSLYDPADAQRALDLHAPVHGEDLALRVYTSRLLGQDPSLVLHGGGNTSVKSWVTELLGDVTEVLYIKGSGADLADIEPRGFPGCRLAHLRRCCERPSMTDEQMVAQLRGQMIDPASPTPSVEALLHAYLPAKFVDHTHADAVLSILDQPDSTDHAREVWGPGVLFVPYVMPGFALARRVAELWRGRSADETPTLMILDKHGIFTWGATAQESYARMIAAVTAAEEWIQERRADASRITMSVPPAREVYAKVAPIFRGALARASGRSWITSWRSSPALIDFSDRDDLAEVSQIGCATPDHVLRTKAIPLVVPGPFEGDPHALRARLTEAIAGYERGYHDYFRLASGARKVTKKELDPWPRVVLFKGLGVLTLGKNKVDAEIAADIYEHTARIIEETTSLDGYQPVPVLDLFDVEYWSLEQAKLARGAAAEGALDRRVALVTGAASGIGLATGRALLAAGAHVVLTDRNAEAMAKSAQELAARWPSRVLHAACDVTSFSDARRVAALAAEHFGGLDVVISNAGTAPMGALHTTIGDGALRGSLEVNLLGHQNVARAATEIMIAQDTGGVLLFNASKSAFNPGPDFGPYAVAKAALIALMRQYAIDLAPRGIRANAVNADRIRTDLFGGGLAEARALARGVPVDEYFRTNLLHRETTVDDVAEAFVYLASAGATTGGVVTVDGGNPAAFPR